ncbi:hypothetical protein ABPG72_000808 [Tetrahymena utriculariae]
MINGIKNLFSYLFDSKDYSTFSGVIDIIVVRQPDESLKSMPFHIRFGTLKVLDNQNINIQIIVNDKKIEDVFMFMLPEGACYFPELNVKNEIQKKLRPSSAILKKFNLKNGYNKIQFVAESDLQGKQLIEGKIYLYNYDTKLVISDVDGTVTKSDVKGHISTIIGKEWTHEDIAELYTNIQKNGYKMVYLSSRPLYFYNYTQGYLKGIIQNGFTMPDGPILLSPDQIISSLNREVVYKKADEFKGALLKDLRRVFPEQVIPIFAGFGNRDTDATACLYAGVLIDNIFIINEQSQVEILGKQEKSSYKKINEKVQEFFPRLPKKKDEKQQKQQLHQ